MTTANTQETIKVEKPDARRLEQLKVKTWPIWEKEVSEFDWQYDEPEICYFLEGDVTVVSKAGEVSFGQGDLVTFPRGLSCRWKIRKAVRKHYHFG